jgi:hypothetical protein
MPGISNELIMSLTLQYDNFIKGMRESKAALQDFQKGASAQGTNGLVKNLTTQFGQINKYYELIGDSSGAVKEKMSLLSGTLRDLTKNGQGNSDMAQRLSGVYKNMTKESLGAKDGVMGIAQSLLKGVPGVSQMSNVMGQVAGAFPEFAAAAGPVGAAIVAIGAAYKFVVIPGIEFNAMLEQQNVAFTAMLKSGDKATQMMSDLKKLSLTTPINLGEGATSAKQMLAYGFAQDEVISNLKMMKTVASAVGVGLGDLTYVYGTLRAQGRAYTRDLMQFAMRGIPIYEYLSKTMGVSVVDLKKMTEEGSIGFKEVEAAMQAMTGEGGKFNGMLEASMKTTQGLKTQIANTWQMFTGAAAEGSSSIFKGILTNLLGLVQELQALGPSFNAVFSVISFIVGAVLNGIINYIKVFATLNHFLQNVVLSIIDLVVWVGSWLDKTLHISDTFRAIGTAISNFGTWLLDSIPILRTILELAGKVKDAIKKWWDRDTNAKSETEYIQGEFTKLITKTSDQYQRLMLMFNNDRELTPTWVSSMAGIYGLSIDQTLKVIATFRKISKQEYDSILRNTEAFMKVNANYWKQYRDDIMGAMNIGDIQATSSVKDALTQVENTLTASSGYTTGIDMAKILGLDSEDTKANVKKSAQKIADDLYEQISKMKDMLVYKSGEGKTFFDGLIAMWNKYNDMLDKEGNGKKTKTAFDDILSQYIDFRAEWATVEGGFSASLVQAINDRIDSLGGVDIKNSTSMLDRELAVIDKKYNDMYAKLETEKADYNLLPFSLTEAIEEMRRMEKLSATLKSKLKSLQDAADTSKMGDNYTDNLKEQYNIQLQLNSLTTMSDANRLENAKALLDTQQKLVNLYQKGNEDQITRSANESIANGVQNGNYSDVAAGVASLSTIGSELGALISGADPITLLITELAKLATSITSISDVLNLITVFGKGINSMIEGPMNTALQYLPKVFTKLGEVVGAILIPFIEIFSDLINLISVPLLIMAELLKRLFVALKPLIKLIMYLAYPFLWLGNMLTSLADALGSFLATEEDKQADLESLYDKELATLQNLYEVGALSGAQYEARLAELKARYATTTATNTADPALVSMLTDIFDAIDAMGVAMSALYTAAKPVLDFLVLLLKPVLVLLLNLLGGFFSDIAHILTAVANFATSILKGDWGAVWSGFISLLKALLGLFVNPIIRAINWILDGIDGIWDPFKDNIGNISELATGTGNVPTDMMSVIHAGESVVPSSFMDAIRSGDLAMTGKGYASGSTIEIHNHIEGSVLAERDLSTSIYNTISLLKKRGAL